MIYIINIRQGKSATEEERMKKFRVTVRDARFDGAKLNPTSKSEVVECPESAVNDMIMCIIHENFGYDEKKLSEMDLRYAYFEIPA